MILPFRLIERLTVFLARTVLGWFDTRAEAPIMRRRINAGSDRYFRQAALTKGELEIDPMLGDGSRGEGDEITFDPREERAHDYAVARRGLTVAAIFLPISILYLLGFRGIGPLGVLLPRMGSMRITLLVSSGIICAASIIQIVRMGPRAVRLRRELAKDVRVRSSTTSR